MTFLLHDTHAYSNVNFDMNEDSKSLRLYDF